MSVKYPLLMFLTILFFSLGVLPSSVFSQTPFYQGKTLKVINNDPGGTAGMRVKAVVSYLRKYIPGNPTIIVELSRVGEVEKRQIDDASPLMPEELVKIIKEIPRHPEVIGMLKKFSGIEPLPPR